MRISCIRPAAGDGGVPLAVQSLAHAGLHMRLEAAVGAPEAFDLYDVFLEASSQAGQIPARPAPLRLRGQTASRTW